MAFLVSFGFSFMFVNRDYESLHLPSPSKEGRAGLLIDTGVYTVSRGRTGSSSSSPTGVMWNGSNEGLCRFMGLRGTCDAAWFCSLFFDFSGFIYTAATPDEFQKKKIGGIVLSCISFCVILNFFENQE